MKRLPLLISVFVSLIVLAFVLGTNKTGSTEIRSRATEPSITPTITPSTTPTITLTPSLTPTRTPTPTPSLTPTPTNSPPRCTGLSVNPGAGAKPLTVKFSCSGYDVDNDITGAEFGFGGDAKQLVEKKAGQFGAITTTYTYTEAGTYNVTCRVRDNNMAFSGYPDYCTYKMVVTQNAQTPTPIRTPIPTRNPNADIVILTGSEPTATPTIKPLPTIEPTTTPLPQTSFWSNEKFAQLAMMVVVSGITIIVALLLHGFFEKHA